MTLLKIKGVGKKTSELLVSNGIKTPSQLASSDVKILTLIGISKSVAEKIINNAQEFIPKDERVLKTPTTVIKMDKIEVEEVAEQEEDLSNFKLPDNFSSLSVMEQRALNLKLTRSRLVVGEARIPLDLDRVYKENEKGDFIIELQEEMK